MANALETREAAATAGHVYGQSPEKSSSQNSTRRSNTLIRSRNAKIASKSLRFRKQGADYVVRIGRNALEIAVGANINDV